MQSLTPRSVNDRKLKLLRLQCCCHFEKRNLAPSNIMDIKYFCLAILSNFGQLLQASCIQHLNGSIEEYEDQECLLGP